RAPALTAKPTGHSPFPQPVGRCREGQSRHATGRDAWALGYRHAGHWTRRFAWCLITQALRIDKWEYLAKKQSANPPALSSICTWQFPVRGLAFSLPQHNGLVCCPPSKVFLGAIGPHHTNGVDARSWAQAEVGARVVAAQVTVA